MIPYGRQDIDNEDIQSVIDVLKSDFLTQGPLTPKFEKIVSGYCGARYAYAMNSATSALHGSCIALGVGKNDIVWTSPITFAASSNCALYCEAKVDFVDIDPRTYNICHKKLESKLIDSKKKNTLPKVLIVVHLCGQPCNMKKIHELSLVYDFKIIEDASHAIGGKFDGEPIGNCKYSDIAVFSFHPVKIITTGEGGMALTNNSDYAKKLDRFRTHGITRNIDDFINKSHGEWYYEQIELGYNYRITDIQSALGISQMKRLNSFIKKRHHIANLYDEMLEGLPLSTPWQEPLSFSSYHLYVVRLKLDEITKSHKVVFSELRNAGVGVNLHYIPVYKHPYYKRLGFADDYCIEAEKYYSEAISIPIFPSMEAETQHKVISSIKEVLLK